MEKTFSGPGFAIYSKRIFNKFLFEKHILDLCSYCKSLENEGNHSFGFWAPRDKSKTSWRTFWYVGSKAKYYLRFTLS